MFPTSRTGKKSCFLRDISVLFEMGRIKMNYVAINERQMQEHVEFQRKEKKAGAFACVDRRVALILIAFMVSLQATTRNHHPLVLRFLDTAPTLLSFFFRSFLFLSNFFFFPPLFPPL